MYDPPYHQCFSANCRAMLGILTSKANTDNSLLFCHLKLIKKH